MRCPFMMPVVDIYEHMGHAILMGKVEEGTTRKGETLFLMPNKIPVTVDQLWYDDNEVTAIGPDEHVDVKIKGIEPEDVTPGFVLCNTVEYLTTGRVFEAQVAILEHKSLICAGYSALMFIHCAAERVTIMALLCLVDKKTGEKSMKRPRYVKQNQVAIMRLKCDAVICLEPFIKSPKMGKFSIRCESKHYYLVASRYPYFIDNKILPR